MSDFDPDAYLAAVASKAPPAATPTPAPAFDPDAYLAAQASAAPTAPSTAGTFDPDAYLAAIKQTSPEATSQPTPEPATGIFHRTMNDLRVVGSSFGSYIEKGLAGIAGGMAEATQHPTLPSAGSIKAGSPAAIQQSLTPDADAPEQAAKLQQVEHYWIGRSESAAAESAVDPTLSKTVDARLAAAAGPAVGMGMEGLIPGLGVPLLALHGAAATRADVISRGGSQEDADNAAARSAIGLGIFGGASKAAALGVAKLLPDGVGPVVKFISQFMGQDAANEASSRAINAWEASQQAKPGDKVAAALKELSNTTLETSTLNAVFAGMGAAGHAGETPSEAMTRFLSLIPDEHLKTLAEDPRTHPDVKVKIQQILANPKRIGAATEAADEAVAAAAAPTAAAPEAAPIQIEHNGITYEKQGGIWRPTSGLTRTGHETLMRGTSKGEDSLLDTLDRKAAAAAPATVVPTPAEPQNETMDHQGNVTTNPTGFTGPAEFDEHGNPVPPPLLTRPSDEEAPRLHTALLNPDGSVLASGQIKPDGKMESHAEIATRASREAMDSGSDDRFQNVMTALTNDSAHGFTQGSGQEGDVGLTRKQAAPLADNPEARQRDKAYEGQPLSSEHLNEQPQPITDPEGRRRSTSANSKIASLVDTFTVEGKEKGQRIITSGAEVPSDAARDAWLEAGMIRKRAGRPGYELTPEGRKIVEAQTTGANDLVGTHAALGVTPEELQSAGKNGARLLAQRLATHPDASPEVRALAAAMARLDTHTSVIIESEIQDQKTNNQLEAAFDPQDNVIRLRSDLFSGTARNATLEELAHAIDLWTQYHPETAAAKRYAADVQRIGEIASAAPGAERFAYALQQHDGRYVELIPNMMSNPEFRAHLNSLLFTEKAGAVAGKAKLTLTAKLLDTMRKLLRIQTGSLADRALKNILNLTQEDIEASQAKANRNLSRRGAEVPEQPAGPTEEDKQLIGKLSDEAPPNTPAGLALKGAQLILEKGTRSYTDWKEALTKTMGTDQLAFQQIWKDTQNLLQDYNAAKTPGTPMGIKSQIKESTDLRTGTNIAQKSVADAISQAEAFKAVLTAEARGGKAGRTATTKELGITDRWMAGTQERVRTDLVAYVNTMLPPAERGRFINRITQVLRRPPLATDDAVMFRRAANVMQAIQWRAEDVYANKLRQEIKSLHGDLLSSPSVSVLLKDAIRDRVKNVALKQPSAASVERLQNVKMARTMQGKTLPGYLQEKLDSLTKTPLGNLSVEELEALRDGIKELGEKGKADIKTQQESDALEHASRLSALTRQTETKPREAWEKMARETDPGAWQRLKDNVFNFAKTTGNWVSLHEKARMFIPHLFDILDGKTNGWLTNNVLKPFYTGYRNYMADHMPVREEALRIATEEKLTREDFLALGVHFHLLQEGTMEEALKYATDKAPIQAAFDDYSKNGLSAGQKRLADYMRNILDAEVPALKDFFQRHYNKELTFYDNYFPRMMDSRKLPKWRAERDEWINPVSKEKININNVAEMFAHITDIQARSRSISKGFAEARVEGAEIPINLNAMEVFLKHHDNVSYVRNVQPSLNVSGRLVNDPVFAAKYGQTGKGLLLEYIDALAKRGQFAKTTTDQVLDYIKNKAMVGKLGFRMSQFKHLANYPNGIAEAGGPHWWSRGLRLSHTPEGQAFLQRYFPEIGNASAGDVTIQEAAQMGKISNTSFIIDRLLDYQNRAAVALGSYMRQLSEAGHDWMEWDNLNVDDDMVNNSRIAYVKAIGSAEVADRPLIVTKGTSVGSRSKGSALMAYQTPKMVRWGTLRTALAIDLWRNPKVFASKMSALVASSLIEAGVKRGSRALLHAGASGLLQLLGYSHHQPKKDDDAAKDIAREAASDFIANVPGGSTVGDALAAAKSVYYRRDILGRTGVPPIDFITEAKQDAGDYVANRTAINATRLLSDLSTLGGVPASIPLDVATEMAKQTKEPTRTSKGLGGAVGKLSKGLK